MNETEESIKKILVGQSHDPQEEEYAKLAEEEGNKFDSRLFWFAGGVGALSLGYFQATGLLHADLLLACGYGFLISGMIVLLLSLQFTSYLHGELSVQYRRKNLYPSNPQEQKDIKNKISRYGAIANKGVLAFNIASMMLISGGAAFLLIYLFINS